MGQEIAWTLIVVVIGYTVFRDVDGNIQAGETLQAPEHPRGVELSIAAVEQFGPFTVEAARPSPPSMT